MGAKKWATILKENYQSAGRFFLNATPEEEIELITNAGFCDANELIQWADHRHYTLGAFYSIYLHLYPNVNFMKSAVFDLFIARYAYKDLHSCLSDEAIISLSDKLYVRNEFPKLLTNEIQANSESHKHKFRELFWLSLNIARMSGGFFNAEEIRDLICFLKYKGNYQIVNNRASLKLIRVFRCKHSLIQ